MPPHERQAVALARRGRVGRGERVPVGQRWASRRVFVPYVLAALCRLGRQGRARRADRKQVQHRRRPHGHRQLQATVPQPRPLSGPRRHRATLRLNDFRYALQVRQDQLRLRRGKPIRIAQNLSNELQLLHRGQSSQPRVRLLRFRRLFLPPLALHECDDDGAPLSSIHAASDGAERGLRQCPRDGWNLRTPVKRVAAAAATNCGRGLRRGGRLESRIRDCGRDGGRVVPAPAPATEEARHKVRPEGVGVGARPAAVKQRREVPASRSEPDRNGGPVPSPEQETSVRPPKRSGDPFWGRCGVGGGGGRSCTPQPRDCDLLAGGRGYYRTIKLTLCHRPTSGRNPIRGDHPIRC
eukprot:scaffold31708_cov242-Isochrysis_galbana.AAC.1